MTKMNGEIKRRWVEALRSGDYRQTKRVLHRLVAGREDSEGPIDPPGFCCLGVLCDIAAENGAVQVSDANGKRTYGRTDLLLPVEVARWAGFVNDDDEPGGVFGGDVLVRPSTGEQQWLSVMNDTGFTFPQIADVIEIGIEEAS